MQVDSDEEKMEYSCFVDIESSRSYVDDLYSDDKIKCSVAMIRLKNAVIGSNRQKGQVILQGIVPRLIAVICDDSNELDLRLNAAIVIGSLAKGTQQHVSSLIYYGIVDLFLAISIAKNTPEMLMEACLSTLKTIMQYPFAPYELIHSNIQNISRLIQIASESDSCRCQAYVTHILIPLYNAEDQVKLYQAGILGFLTKLIVSKQSVLQIPALKCLASLCFSNKLLSDIICKTEYVLSYTFLIQIQITFILLVYLNSYEGKVLPDILTDMQSRTQPVQIQLSASRCLTYLERSGAMSASDVRIVYKTMPCLARLCTPQFEDEIRASAAENLAYLTEIDTELQRLAAISNHLIHSLSTLLKSSHGCGKKGAFRCLASICANDENIRKRIVEIDGLMNLILQGLKDKSLDVRLAAVRLLHSLSRSVQLLRTAFQDHIVWHPLMELLNEEPSSELLSVVTSTICNLLLEFSPAKEPLLESGAVEILCEKLIKNPDALLRLNGSWALMNMAFQAELNVKIKIIDTLGPNNIIALLKDSDVKIIMKTLGLIRNLLSNSQHITVLMAQHNNNILKALNNLLDINHPIEVQEQVLCIMGNIAAASGEHNYILENDPLIKKVSELIEHPDMKIQQASIFVVANLLQKKEAYLKLKRFDIIRKLENMQDVLPLATQQECNQRESFKILFIKRISHKMYKIKSKVD
uniref:Armadillo repeat-containing protein 8 n=1 Tax=Culicoides sonorensis TaxID=179676 RepID=A0A336LHC5_CULSO